MSPARRDDIDQLRLVTKVARLYHSQGLRQREIGERLRLSQSRVSRLLRQAEEAGVVKTVVVVPPEIHAELEDGLERRFGLVDVHVVDSDVEDEDALHRDLGSAAAAFLHPTLQDAGIVGFTSWSRSMTAMVEALEPASRQMVGEIVEMLGDLGDPSTQHVAARATQRFADRTGARAVFLRTPGIVAAPEMRDAILAQDPYAREAMARLDALDLAFVGVGHGEIDEQLLRAGIPFDPEHVAQVRAHGAVANLNFRFLDAAGAPVVSRLDELVIGVSLEQLRRAGRTIAIAGGASKHAAILALLRGRWLDVLVTDVATAEHVLAHPATQRASPPPARPSLPGARAPGAQRRLAAVVYPWGATTTASRRCPAPGRTPAASRICTPGAGRPKGDSQRGRAASAAGRLRVCTRSVESLFVA